MIMKWVEWMSVMGSLCALVELIFPKEKPQDGVMGLLA